MAKKFAKIPADLRDRADLTVGDLQRVLALRKRRKALRTRLTRLPVVRERLNHEIAHLSAQEQAILGVSAADAGEGGDA